MASTTFEFYNLDQPIALQCGCVFLRLFDCLAVTWHQLIWKQPVVCPYHGIPHQFVVQPMFIQAAIMVWQLNQKWRGDPKDVRFEMGEEQYVSVTHPTFPSIKLIKL